MGHVRIRFFASFRDKMGHDELTLDIKGDTTVSQVIDKLNDSPGGLKELFKNGTAIVAVNHEVVNPESVVNDGDEIAIFPPVSGG